MQLQLLPELERQRLLATGACFIYLELRHCNMVCRDLVDVSVGKPPHRPLLVISGGLALLGALLFLILLLAAHKGAAIGALSALLVVAAVLAAYEVAMEHFVEGVDMVIDACKCASPPLLFVLHYIVRQFSCESHHDEGQVL